MIKITNMEKRLFQRMALLWRRALEPGGVMDDPATKQAGWDRDVTTGERALLNAGFDITAEDIKARGPELTPGLLCRWEAAIFDALVTSMAGERDDPTNLGLYTDYEPCHLLTQACESVGVEPYCPPLPMKSCTRVNYHKISDLLVPCVGESFGYAVEWIWHYPVESGWVVTVIPPCSVMDQLKQLVVMANEGFAPAEFMKIGELDEEGYGG